MRKVIKLVITAGVTMMLTVYCFDGGDGVIGNLIHAFMVGFFGDLRYILIPSIIIGAIYYAKYYIFAADDSDDGRWS